MSNNKKWMIFDFVFAVIDTGLGIYNITQGSVGEGSLLIILAAMLAGCGFTYKRLGI